MCGTPDDQDREASEQAQYHKNGDDSDMNQVHAGSVNDWILNHLSKIAPTPWTANHDGHGGICLDDSKGRQIGFLSNRREQEDHAKLFKYSPQMFLLLGQALEALRGSAGPDEIANVRTEINDIFAKIRSE